MDRDDDEYDATVPVDTCATKRRLATKRLVAIDDIMMMMMMMDDLSSVVCVDNFPQILTKYKGRDLAYVIISTSMLRHHS